MNAKIGFILVTHNKPHQLMRLISCLNRMFDSPPIVCHHNFAITPFDTSSIPQNVDFVKPHVQTRWGKFSTIDAELKALEMLYGRADAPDWFVLLSGSDYPIKSADKIVEDLAAKPYDVCMHHEIVKYDSLKSGWQKLGYQRYCIVRGWLPTLNRQGKPQKKFFTILKNPSLTKFFIPFSDEFPCFVGDHFFSANHRAAQYLIDSHNANRELASYYRKSTIFPTESYYQTIFCNSSDIRVENNNWRYIDWSNKDDPHPKLLGLEDLPAIQASSAHFARKLDIDVDPIIFDEIDKMIH